MLLKAILGGFVSTLLFCLPSVGQTQSDREASGLKGDVKRIHVEGGTIREVDGKSKEVCCQPVYSSTYDVKGNLVESKSATQPIDFGPIRPLKKEVKYEKGKIIEELTYEPDGSLLMKTIFTYDALGNKSEVSIFSPNNSFYRKQLFRYDESSNLIEYLVQYGDGSPLTRETYSNHDAKGNWLKEITWHWDSLDKIWEPYTVWYRTITYH